MKDIFIYSFAIYRVELPTLFNSIYPTDFFSRNTYKKTRRKKKKIYENLKPKKKKETIKK